MIRRLVVLGEQLPDLARFGSKALGLWRLRQCGACVPRTVLVAPDVTVRRSDLAWISDQLDHPEEFAVRSSSEREDQEAESCAGVFRSEIATLDGMLEALERVRYHSPSVIPSGGVDRPIPVVIQPRLTGLGGVYLFDRRSGHDSLELSVLGPSAVTGGVSLSSDKLSGTAPDYLTTLSVCRDVAMKLTGSVDLELVVIAGAVTFLQCRPLSRPLVQPDPEVVNQYFPTWLPPLCGTLWVEQVQKVGALDQVRLEQGFIRWNERDACGEANRALCTEVLEATEHLYRQHLFPSWDAAITRVQSLLGDVAPEHAYRITLEIWDRFWGEYFNNPAEPVVAAARAASPAGMAITPRTRARLLLFAEAAKQVQHEMRRSRQGPADLLALPSVKDYRAKYGFYLLECNDFSQPTLDEQPEALLAQLRRAAPAVPAEVEGTDALLRVAWLSEDDNEYKHKYCSLLRSSIIRLADHWVRGRLIPSVDHIWRLTNREVDALLRGGATRPVTMPQYSLAVRPTPLLEGVRHSATVLSPGQARGTASRGAINGSQSILLRTVLDAVDYPLLMGAAGAVVALGAEHSHAAIFARDVRKPLYRCPSIVFGAPEGANLVLVDSPASVELGSPR